MKYTHAVRMYSDVQSFTPDVSGIMPATSAVVRDPMA
jgi:hypothetical protein